MSVYIWLFNCTSGVFLLAEYLYILFPLPVTLLVYTWTWLDRSTAWKKPPIKCTKLQFGNPRRKKGTSPVSHDQSIGRISQKCSYPVARKRGRVFVHLGGSFGCCSCSCSLAAAFKLVFNLSVTVVVAVILIVVIIGVEVGDIVLNILPSNKIAIWIENRHT